MTTHEICQKESEMLITRDTPVVSAGDGVELFLAGSVPQHQPDLFTAVDVDDTLEKVNTDGFFVRGSKDALAVASNETGLTDSAISDNNDLKKKQFQ